MTKLIVKRIYDTPLESDGIRILVDRLWQRGVTKEKAHIDYWFKEITPSSYLRKWFGHKPERFEEFAKDYQDELKIEMAKITEIKDLLKNNNVTLLYAAKDPQINHAVILKQFIEQN